MSLKPIPTTELWVCISDPPLFLTAPTEIFTSEQAARTYVQNSVSNSKVITLDQFIVDYAEQCTDNGIAYVTSQF